MSISNQHPQAGLFDTVSLLLFNLSFLVTIEEVRLLDQVDGWLWRGSEEIVGAHLQYVVRRYRLGW